MDPASLGSALLVYGPLGILSALGLYWGWNKDKKATELQKTFEDAQRKQADTFAADLKAQSDGFAEDLKNLQTSHRNEVTELTDRFINLSSAYSARYEALLDKVSIIAEAFSRARQRPPMR